MFSQNDNKALRVKTLADFRAPSRRPWLVILLVLIVGAGLIVNHRVRRSRRSAQDTPVDRAALPDAEASTAADVPSVVRPVAAAQPSSARPAPSVPRISAEVAAGRLTEARRLAAEDKLLDARDLLLDLLPAVPTDALRRDVEKLLGDLQVKLVTTPRMMPEKIEYLIRSGDSLGSIANRFGTSIELIQLSNNIANPNRIQLGNRLRLLNQPKFAIRIRKRHSDLLLTLNGRFFKRYAVGTGEYGKTPEGTFMIRDRIEQPPWWPAGGREIPFGHPENILGTRWMGLVATGDTPSVRGYGIHGTWDESTIGKQSSAGCVRMRNADVEELFLFAGVGTPVSITE